MATPDNVQSDLAGRALPFFAPSPSSQALGTNIFSQVIAPSHNAYVFPPFVLVGPLIRFLASQDCPYTIVVPNLRPRKYWWPLLVSSCVDSFKLGSRGDRDILLFLADTISGMESRPLYKPCINLVFHAGQCCFSYHLRLIVYFVLKYLFESVCIIVISPFPSPLGTFPAFGSPPPCAPIVLMLTTLALTFANTADFSPFRLKYRKNLLRFPRSARH